MTPEYTFKGADDISPKFEHSIGHLGNILVTNRGTITVSALKRYPCYGWKEGQNVQVCMHCDVECYLMYCISLSVMMHKLFPHFFVTVLEYPLPTGLCINT